MGSPPRRCPGYDAVKVIGKHLSLFDALPSSSRTAAVAAIGRVFSIIGTCQFFAKDDRAVQDTVTPIRDLFWSVVRPAPVEWRAIMT